MKRSLRKIRLRVKERRLATKKKRFLTDEEKHIIADLFPNTFTYEIAERLGRSYSTVANYAYTAGIYKSEEFREKEWARQAQRLQQAGNVHRFSKGHMPHNKGKKVSSETYARMAPTMFKKGQAPHNTRTDGAERIDVDGYVLKRLGPGKWVPKHRYVWEEANGPVPDGMALVFKDGNKQNITLDNLELVTRQELMLRNTIQRYPTELVSTIKALSKLKKHLYAKEQN